MLYREFGKRKNEGSVFLTLKLHLKEIRLRFCLAKTEDCAKLRQMQLFILIELKHLCYKTIIFNISFTNLRKICFWSWHKRIIIVIIIIMIIHCSRVIQTFL